MKNFISIFLIVTHLFSSIGLNVSVHQCGDETSYSFFGIGFSHCECEHSSEDHEEDCCSDKKIELKSNADFKHIEKILLKERSSSYALIPVISYFLHSQALFKTTIKKHYQRAYPSNFSPPRYILFRNFRV